MGQFIPHKNLTVMVSSLSLWLFDCDLWLLLSINHQLIIFFVWIEKSIRFFLRLEMLIKFRLWSKCHFSHCLVFFSTYIIFYTLCNISYKIQVIFLGIMMIMTIIKTHSIWAQLYNLFYTRPSQLSCTENV